MMRKVPSPTNSILLPRTCDVIMRTVSLYAALALCVAAISLRADQVVMQNGDCYNGKVLSVTTNTLVFQNDILGTVNLPRARVTLIALGTNATANVARTVLPAIPSRASSVTAQTNANSSLSATLRELGTQTNLAREVQAQFLSTAGPEANDKFNQLLDGLISGAVTMDGLRAEAKSAADQLREFKQDLGDDAGEVDVYLSILDNFLRETTPRGAPVTNATGTLLKSKPEPAHQKK